MEICKWFFEFYSTYTLQVFLWLIYGTHFSGLFFFSVVYPGRSQTWLAGIKFRLQTTWLPWLSAYMMKKLGFNFLKQNALIIWGNKKFLVILTIKSNLSWPVIILLFFCTFLWQLRVGWRLCRAKPITP